MDLVLSLDILIFIFFGLFDRAELGIWSCVCVFVSVHGAVFFDSTFFLISFFVTALWTVDLALSISVEIFDMCWSISTHHSPRAYVRPNGFRTVPAAAAVGAAVDSIAADHRVVTATHISARATRPGRRGGTVQRGVVRARGLEVG